MQAGLHKTLQISALNGRNIVRVDGEEGFFVRLTTEKKCRISFVLYTDGTKKTTARAILGLKKDRKTHTSGKLEINSGTWVFSK